MRKVQLLLSIICLVFSGTQLFAVCQKIQLDGLGTCANSDCVNFCARQIQSISWNALTPGFQVTQFNHKYLVSQILPNSPAQQSGLKSGDQLISVDNKLLPLCSFEAALWQRPGTHHLQILRGDTRVEVAVTPVPLRVALAAALEESGIAKNVALRRDHNLTLPAAPFLSGLSLGVHGRRVFVTAVLQHSPAALAGMEQSDEIIALNGQRISADSLRSITASDHRARFTLTVSRNGATKIVDLKMFSVSDLMESVSRDPMQSASTL